MRKLFLLLALVFIVGCANAEGGKRSLGDTLRNACEFVESTCMMIPNTVDPPVEEPASTEVPKEGAE